MKGWWHWYFINVDRILEVFTVPPSEITLFLISVCLNKITEEVRKLKLNQSFMVYNKNGKT